MGVDARRRAYLGPYQLAALYTAKPQLSPRFLHHVVSLVILVRGSANPLEALRQFAASQLTANAIRTDVPVIAAARSTRLVDSMSGPADLGSDSRCRRYLRRPPGIS